MYVYVCMYPRMYVHTYARTYVHMYVIPLGFNAIDASFLVLFSLDYFFFSLSLSSADFFLFLFFSLFFFFLFSSPSNHTNTRLNISKRIQVEDMDTLRQCKRSHRHRVQQPQLLMILEAAMRNEHRQSCALFYHLYINTNTTRTYARS